MSGRYKRVDLTLQLNCVDISLVMSGQKFSETVLNCDFIPLGI